MAKTKVEEMVALGATRPADPLNIPLGSEVYDVITGLQGTLTQRIRCRHGNIRYGVQPLGLGGTIPEAMTLDYHTLLVVGPGTSAVASKVPNPTTIKINDRVHNRISGFEGIVAGIIEFFNGCEYLEVHGKATEKHPSGTTAVSQAFEWIKIDDGLNVPEAKPGKAEKADKKAKPPGGPMTRSMATAAVRF